MSSTTGCKKPCKYSKYYKTKVCQKCSEVNYFLVILFTLQDMTFLTDPSGKLGFMFGYSSNSLTVKKEAYLYPTTSFIAEFGGSLGLFLGLSFLSVWDIVLFVSRMFCKKSEDDIAPVDSDNNPKQAWNWNKRLTL